MKEEKIFCNCISSIGVEGEEFGKWTCRSCKKEVFNPNKPPTTYLLEKVKVELIRQLISNDQIADEPYIVFGNKSWTRRELAKEIEGETEVGIEQITNILDFALDIMTRTKEL